MLSRNCCDCGDAICVKALTQILLSLLWNIICTVPNNIMVRTITDDSTAAVTIQWCRGFIILD